MEKFGVLVVIALSVFLFLQAYLFFGKSHPLKEDIIEADVYVSIGAAMVFLGKTLYMLLVR